jgi:two-component system cell cycle response regulator DivK
MTRTTRSNQPRHDRRYGAAQVLLVDRSQDGLDMYAIWCRQVGFEVRTATDPIEALRMAENSPPDVVVADVRICRGYDGLELLEHLRTGVTTAAIPRLVLTGYLSAAARELADLSQCRAFLSKPCAPEQLVDAIASALRHSPRTLAPLAPPPSQRAARPRSA